MSRNIVVTIRTRDGKTHAHEKQSPASAASLVEQHFPTMEQAWVGLFIDGALKSVEHFEGKDIRLA